MPTWADLRQQRCDLEIVVNLGGDEIPIRFAYNPVAVTTDLEDQQWEFARQLRVNRVQDIYLERVLVWWDLEDYVLDEAGERIYENGEPLLEPTPISSEGLAKIPFLIKDVMYAAIKDDLPNRRAASRSANRS